MVLVNLKMGSCAVTQKRLHGSLHHPKPNQKFVAFLRPKQNQEYLCPETREEIFRIKDGRAPRLHLEINQLYLKRRFQIHPI